MWRWYKAGRRSACCKPRCVWNQPPTVGRRLPFTALEAGHQALQRLEQYRPAIKVEEPTRFDLMMSLFADLHDMLTLRLEHLDVLMQLDIAADLPELFTQRARLLTALSLLFDRACRRRSPANPPGS